MKYSLTHTQQHFLKPIFKLSLLSLCLISAATAFGQKETSTEEPHKIAIAAGIGAGLNAIFSVDVAATVLPNLGIRIGYNYLEFSKDDYETSLSKLGIGNNTTPFYLDANPKLSTAQLWLEYMPGSDKLVRIQAGLALAVDNKIEVKGRYSDTFFFNDFPVTPDRLGDMTITYTSNKILPYLGLGFGQSVPEKLLSLSLEVGAYYRGQPKITIVGTELFEPNNTNANAEVISENASKYKIHPVMALRLGVRLSKRKSN